MTIEEAKKILPPELKYPLPDEVVDNLINLLAIPLKWDFGDYIVMAALLELKEHRERGKDDKEIN